MRGVLLSAFLLLLASSVKSLNVTTSVTPTSSPLPTPLYPEATWLYREIVNGSESGPVCILMRAKLRMHVTYMQENATNKTMPPVSATVMLPFSGVANVSNSASYCEHLVPNDHSHSQSQLTLEANYDGSDNFYLSFLFEEDKRKGHQLWQLLNVQFSFTAVKGSVFRNLSGPSSNVSVMNDDDKYLMFLNELERSFRCDSASTISLGAPTNSSITAVSMDIEDWRVQAFRFKDHEGDKGKFGQARRCQDDLNKKDNTVVPIAVGAALGALVIIIIIAYLIGRFKVGRRNASYEPLS